MSHMTVQAGSASPGHSPSLATPSQRLFRPAGAGELQSCWTQHPRGDPRRPAAAKARTGSLSAQQAVTEPARRLAAGQASQARWEQARIFAFRLRQRLRWPAVQSGVAAAALPSARRPALQTQNPRRLHLARFERPASRAPAPATGSTVVGGARGASPDPAPALDQAILPVLVLRGTPARLQVRGGPAEMVAMTVSAHPAAAPTDLLSPQACRLWNAYQSAAGVLGESLRDLGFIDLVSGLPSTACGAPAEPGPPSCMPGDAGAAARTQQRQSVPAAQQATCLRQASRTAQVVYGRQTTGKSSLLGALCGIQLPTGENQVRCMAPFVRSRGTGVLRARLP